MMTYETIQQKRKMGGTLTVGELQEAIAAQEEVTKAQVLATAKTTSDPNVGHWKAEGALKDEVRHLSKLYRWLGELTGTIKKAEKAPPSDPAPFGYDSNLDEEDEEDLDEEDLDEDEEDYEDD